MPKSVAYEWYAQLIKPSWAPPQWLFGPVWTVLYAIIAISFGTILYNAITGRISWMIAAPFLLNLCFNALFTPIQFGLRNNALASVDILLVVATLVWAMLVVWYQAPQLQWVVYANIPYLLWGSFATVLQLTVTYLNR